MLSLSLKDAAVTYQIGIRKPTSSPSLSIFLQDSVGEDALLLRFKYSILLRDLAINVKRTPFSPTVKTLISNGEDGL